MAACVPCPQHQSAPLEDACRVDLLPAGKAPCVDRTSTRPTATGTPPTTGTTTLASVSGARFPPEPRRSRSRRARTKRPGPFMISTVGVRVEMGARYHGGACFGSLVGRQAPPVCLGRAKRSTRVKRARLLRCMSLLLALNVSADTNNSGKHMLVASFSYRDPNRKSWTVFQSRSGDGEDSTPFLFEAGEWLDPCHLGPERLGEAEPKSRLAIFSSTCIASSCRGDSPAIFVSTTIVSRSFG